MIGLKIKRLIEAKGIAIKKFAQMMNTSEQNLYNIFKRNTVDSGLLEEIAQILNVHPGYFFEEEESKKSNYIKGDQNIQDSNFFNEPAPKHNKSEELLTENLELKKEVARLNKELNACKDKVIELLEKSKK